MGQQQLDYICNKQRAPAKLKQLLNNVQVLRDAKIKVLTPTQVQSQTKSEIENFDIHIPALISTVLFLLCSGSYTLPLANVSRDRSLNKKAATCTHVTAAAGVMKLRDFTIVRYLSNATIVDVS